MGYRLRSASPYLLAALLVGAGAGHFSATDRYAQIIPSVFPRSLHRLLVQASGGTEFACAGLLVVRRTRWIGAAAAAVLFVAVFPANVQMTLDGGIAGAGFPLGSPVVAWLRLPLQLPLIAWAVAIARSGSGRRADPRIV